MHRDVRGVVLEVRWQCYAVNQLILEMPRGKSFQFSLRKVCYRRDHFGTELLVVGLHGGFPT